VAIVGSVRCDHRIVFADEPTWDRGAGRGAWISELLLWRARQDIRTFVAVTHDPALAALGDRQLYLREGHLQEQLA